MAAPDAQLRAVDSREPERRCSVVLCCLCVLACVFWSMSGRRCPAAPPPSAQWAAAWLVAFDVLLNPFPP